MAEAPTIDLETEAGDPIQNALGAPEPRGGAEPPQPPAAAAPPPPATDSNAPAAVPAPPAAPVVTPEPDLEPKATDDAGTRGLKAALAAERAKNRESKSQIDAARFLTQQLQNHPDLANQLDARIRGIVTQPPVVTQPPAAPQPAASEFSEQQLRDTAQNLVLYDPQKPGELDLKAAERVLKSFKSMASEIATQAAEKAVQPVASHVQQSKLQTNSQRILAEAQANGIQPAVMSPLVSAIGASQPELLEDPGVAQLLMFIAKGMSNGQQPPAAAPVTTPTAAPREPILTEAPGGQAPKAAAPLDDLQARVARKLGLSHEKYNEAVGKMPTQGGWRHINLE